MSAQSEIHLVDTQAEKDASEVATAIQEARARIEAEIEAQLALQAQMRAAAHTRAIAQAKVGCKNELAKQIGANIYAKSKLAEEVEAHSEFERKLTEAAPAKLQARMCLAQEAQAGFREKLQTQKELEQCLVSDQKTREAAKKSTRLEQATVQGWVPAKELIAKTKEGQIKDEKGAFAQINARATPGADASEARQIHLCAEADRRAAELAQQRTTIERHTKDEAEVCIAAETKAIEAAETCGEVSAEIEQKAVLEREEANALLRKAELEARERLAAEMQLKQAMQCKLQAERDLAIHAQQRAKAEIAATRGIELQLQAEAEAEAEANRHAKIAAQAKEAAEERARLERELADAELSKLLDDRALVEEMRARLCAGDREAMARLEQAYTASKVLISDIEIRALNMAKLRAETEAKAVLVKSEKLQAETRAAALAHQRLAAAQQAKQLAEESERIEQYVIAEIEARMAAKLQAIKNDKEHVAIEARAKEIMVARLKLTGEAVAAAKAREDTEVRALNMAKLRAEAEAKAAQIESEKLQAEARATVLVRQRLAAVQQAKQLAEENERIEHQYLERTLHKCNTEISRRNMQQAQTDAEQCDIKKIEACAAMEKQAVDAECNLELELTERSSHQLVQEKAQPQAAEVLRAQEQPDEQMMADAREEMQHASAEMETKRFLGRLCKAGQQHSLLFQVAVFVLLTFGFVMLSPLALEHSAPIISNVQAVTQPAMNDEMHSLAVTTALPIQQEQVVHRLPQDSDDVVWYGLKLATGLQAYPMHDELSTRLN